jgi:hypothetical protein
MLSSISLPVRWERNGGDCHLTEETILAADGSAHHRGLRRINLNAWFIIDFSTT